MQDDGGGTTGGFPFEHQLRVDDREKELAFGRGEDLERRLTGELREEPRILFLHYWGRGKAADLATAVKKALDLTAWAGKVKAT